MKVILLKDVAKVGRRFDTKDVSDGYALNMLIPRGLAVAATPDAEKRLMVQKAKADGERKVNDELLSKNIGMLESVLLVIEGKANEKGHLFAGLHKEEIAAELEKQTRIKIDPSSIILEHPIKEVGEHTVLVQSGEKKGAIKVEVKGK